MLNKGLFMRQLVLLNNTSSSRRVLLGSAAIRGFYYPDANHHHLNQEVSLEKLMCVKTTFKQLIQPNLLADRVSQAYHQVCGRPPAAHRRGTLGRRAGHLQDELELGE